MRLHTQMSRTVRGTNYSVLLYRDQFGPWLLLLMINDLSIPDGLIQGDMIRYADNTKISECILGLACSNNMQWVTNSTLC